MRSNKDGSVTGMSQPSPMKFSPQQLRAIKESPKGVLPKFITAGMYNQKDAFSVGGKVGKVGAAVGYDKVQKKPFGSVNVNGIRWGGFGPK